MRAAVLQCVGSFFLVRMLKHVAQRHLADNVLLRGALTGFCLRLFPLVLRLGLVLLIHPLVFLVIAENYLLVNQKLFQILHRNLEASLFHICQHGVHLHRDKRHD